MSANTTTKLAVLASVIAAVAIVLRLVRGSGDYFEIIGPLGIILLMIIIISKNKARPNG